MLLVTSERRGNRTLPKPPCLLGVLILGSEEKTGGGEEGGEGRKGEGREESIAMVIKTPCNLCLTAVTVVGGVCNLQSGNQILNCNRTLAPSLIPNLPGLIQEVGNETRTGWLPSPC